jgi:hypothetical protein
MSLKLELGALPWKWMRILTSLNIIHQFGRNEWMCENILECNSFIYIE